MLNMLDARKKGLAHEETSMLPAGKTIEPVMGSAKKTLKDFGNKGLPVAKVSQVRSYSRVEGDESNSEKTNLTGSQNLQRKSIDQRSRLELATLASRNERRPSGAICTIHNSCAKTKLFFSKAKLLWGDSRLSI